MNSVGLIAVINRATEAHQASARGLAPIYDTQAVAARAFGDLLGWKLATVPFSTRALLRARQHDGQRSWHQPQTALASADYFRVLGRATTPMAIVWHAPGPIELELGLTMIILPIPSWRIPESRPVLIARPAERDLVLARLALPS